MANKNKTQSGKSGGKASETPAAAATPATVSEKQVAAPRYPLFYAQIDILNANVHGGLRYHPVLDYGFAATTNSIPLTATEFSDAAAFFPIVFAGQGARMEPMAVVGHKKGVNPFVDQLGYWRKDTYIPAYVRRYPFIMVGDTAGNMFLAADTSSNTFSDEEQAEAIYVDGKPSDVAKRALQFCLAYNKAQQATAGLCQAIESAGILVERTAEVRMPGNTNSIRGFRIVDEVALNKLTDDAWLALRKSGALPVIYTHLLSMKAWKNILS